VTLNNMIEAFNDAYKKKNYETIKAYLYSDDLLMQKADDLGQFVSGNSGDIMKYLDSQLEDFPRFVLNPLSKPREILAKKSLQCGVADHRDKQLCSLVGVVSGKGQYHDEVKGTTPKFKGTTPKSEGTTPKSEGTTPIEVQYVFYFKRDTCKDNWLIWKALVIPTDLLTH
jgi:hypothetical protein